MTELLTVYDQNFNKIGAEERAKVHTLGLWHAVVHCWVVSKREDGVWLWFQKRAHSKNAFPDYYDTAVGGHISAGETPQQALLRETGEELGLQLQPEQVELLGMTKEKEAFPESPFPDREFCFVYLYENPTPQFAPGEEVDDMIRIRLATFKGKELHELRQIPALSLSSGPLTLQPEMFCRHPGEFLHLILPKLEEET